MMTLFSVICDLFLTGFNIILTNASLNYFFLKIKLPSQQSPVRQTQPTAQTHQDCWRALQLSLMLSMSGYLMETHSLALSWKYFWAVNLMNECTAVAWATPWATKRPISLQRIATLVGLHVAFLQPIVWVWCNMISPTSIGQFKDSSSSPVMLMTKTELQRLKLGSAFGLLCRWKFLCSGCCPVSSPAAAAAAGGGDGSSDLQTMS